MKANLPVAFGLAMVGAVLVEKGGKAFGSSLSSSGSVATSATGSPAPAGSPAIPIVPSSGGQRQGSVTMGDLQAIGKAYGWSGAQLQAWWNVISAESGGNPNARNPSSGAFGIGQFLGSTLQQYAPYGATSSDPIAQLTAMARYIHDRYGSPASAWAHEQSAHWY